ncbi:uncharacterized protein LOC135849084 isoform X2 [Planococcus citri]|uniref:uncharacterized protein LOC135849084 isoform X2 n=1 Tax=Planococcus citri TaxID=170843 RepID=UPI0031F84F8F
MFSLKMILIFAVCLTICCQIRSTSAWGYTTIETLMRRIKAFLYKVKKLDSRLTIPKAAEKDFKNIKYKDGLFWSIKSNKTYLKEFRTEYGKLRTCTINVINSLRNQMDKIELNGHWVGKQSRRIKICNYYVKKFSTKLAIKGAGAKDPTIAQIDKDLKTSLYNLYVKINNMAVNYDNAKQETSTSCSFFFCFIPLPI